MKQIEAIKALLTNCWDMEQMGVYTFDGLEDAQEFFGQGGFEPIRRVMDLPIEGKVYIYHYELNGEVPDFANKQPNAVYRTDDGCRIGLYELEDARKY